MHPRPINPVREDGYDASLDVAHIEAHMGFASDGKLDLQVARTRVGTDPLQREHSRRALLHANGLSDREPGVAEIAANIAVAVVRKHS